MYKACENLVLNHQFRECFSQECLCDGFMAKPHSKWQHSVYFTIICGQLSNSARFLFIRYIKWSKAYDIIFFLSIQRKIPPKLEKKHEDASEKCLLSIQFICNFPMWMQTKIVLMLAVEKKSKNAFQLFANGIFIASWMNRCRHKQLHVHYHRLQWK